MRAHCRPYCIHVYTIVSFFLISSLFCLIRESRRLHDWAGLGVHVWKASRKIGWSPRGRRESTQVAGETRNMHGIHQGESVTISSDGVYDCGIVFGGTGVI